MGGIPLHDRGLGLSLLAAIVKVPRAHHLEPWSESACSSALKDPIDPTAFTHILPVQSSMDTLETIKYLVR